MPAHIPVMLTEVLEMLNPQPGNIYIDGTLGMGGHTEAILSQTAGKAKVIGFDRDGKSLKLASERLLPWKESFTAVHGRFSQIPQLLNKDSLKEPIGGVLLDLGISSFQLDNAEYGLSFAKQALNESLDMRLDPWCKNNAQEILNTWPEKKLADLFWDKADYKQARKLAKIICLHRPIKTIGDFVELCKQASGGHGKLNASTLPLMALRIEVNEEFQEIENGLTNIINWLEPETKLVVIAFHSGEDRIVKNIFKNSPKLKVITDKPLTPTLEEIKKNTRARSAKLRVACRISSIE
jgi:16S rRNA (cytosine1402-N4)-methyltransferase